MPLKLVAPREGRTPYWYVRGTYLGIAVDRSTKSTERKVAQAALKSIKTAIECGKFAPALERTFLSAAVSYMKNGGDRAFLAPILARIGTQPLDAIDQGMVDNLAISLRPTGSPATRNRQVYTPISAVLKHAGVERALKRPKGARGKQRMTWLRPEQAFSLIESATRLDAEFGIFLTFLLYTGVRLSEACSLKTDHVWLNEGYAYLPQTKNGEAQPVYLPPNLVVALANHPRGMDRPNQNVFRFRKNGRIYALIKQTKKDAGLAKMPKGECAFHVFRHTYATWMMRYGGLDKGKLVDVGRWKDQTSASRYAHVIVSEEAQKANMLPTRANVVGIGENAAKTRA